MEEKHEISEEQERHYSNQPLDMYKQLLRGCKHMNVLIKMKMDLITLSAMAEDRIGIVESKKPCKYFDLAANICSKTGVIKNEKIPFEYCTQYFSMCGIRSGLVVLEENEYVNGMVDEDLAVAGKTFVNNLGIRFKCVANSTILCPTCNNELTILSFKFGIFCPHCKKMIH